MSGKTNKTLNSALGVLSPVTKTIIASNGTAIYSGMVWGTDVIRVDTDFDCSLEINERNTAECNKWNSATLFAGVPEVFSTPAAVTGTDEDESIHVMVSGISSGGIVHVTRLKTRGE